MSKLRKNKILISILCFLMIITMSLTIFATTTNIGGISVTPNTSGPGTEGATKIGNSIIGVLQVVGILLSVGCLMVLGIKYMMGSAEEKAEYKKTFIPFLIGALLLFAASAFAKTIYEWVNSFNG